MQVLSYPFRIESTGRPALVEQGGDEWAAQQIYSFIMTHQGERDLSPNFGSQDLLFQPEINFGEILVSFVEFYPEIEIDSATVDISEYGERFVQVQFSVTDGVDEDA